MEGRTFPVYSDSSCCDLCKDLVELKTTCKSIVNNKGELSVAKKELALQSGEGTCDAK